LTLLRGGDLKIIEFIVLSKKKEKMSRKIRKNKTFKQNQYPTKMIWIFVVILQKLITVII